MIRCEESKNERTPLLPCKREAVVMVVSPHGVETAVCATHLGPRVRFWLADDPTQTMQVVVRNLNYEDEKDR